MVLFAVKLVVRRKRPPPVLIRGCTILVFNVKILREMECMHFL